MLSRTFIISVFLNALVIYSAMALDIIPDRRKNQFSSEYAWYVIPFPYSYPGIGDGIIGLVNFSNIFGTRADITASLITGDAKGEVLQIGDLFLIPNFFYLNGTSQSIDSLTVQNYDTRGINSDKNAFTFMEASKLKSTMTEGTITLWDRRIEITGKKETNSVNISAIRNSDGDIISELDEPFKQDSSNETIGIKIDLTDDFQDPHKGIRFNIERTSSERQDDSDPNFYVINKTIDLYIPIGNTSTWAFQYLKSDAFVTDEGTTNEAELINKLGLNCAPTDTVCLKTQTDIVAQFQDQNKYGTADSLGGLNRLRSYSNGRFTGAHTLYYGTELRLNLTQELTPFDYGIWQDTRTGIQLALFYEMGSVSEKESDLGDEFVKSYGAGLRMITGSGFVYRFDVATGDEGTLPVIWFYYPW